MALPHWEISGARQVCSSTVLPLGGISGESAPCGHALSLHLKVDQAPASISRSTGACQAYWG